MRIRNVLVSAAVAALTFGFTAAPQTTATSPGGALQTNPIGSMRWLPVVANESPAGFGIDRLVVVYDGSLDAVSGDAIDLIADAGYGMKLFSNSVTDSAGNEPPAITLEGHTPWVTTLEGLGAPAGTDAAFAGMAGDVTDGDCANLDASDPEGSLSYAYSTTYTVDGDVNAEACQVIESQATDPDTGAVVSTTITEYVPGIWFDVKWPMETDPAGSGGQGHSLSEVWYGAIPGYSTDDPTTWQEAGESGFSETIRGQSDVFFTTTLQDPEPNPTVLEACPTTGHTVEVEIPTPPPGAKVVHVDLYPQGDWDLTVVDQTGTSTQSGNFIVNERVTVPATAGTIEVEGCNFAGGPFAELQVGWA